MKFLIATDGSKFSQAAVAKCCELFAGLKGSEIRTISAYEPVITGAEPFAFSAEYLEEIDSAASKKAADVVSQAEEQMRSAFNDNAAFSSRVVKGYANQVIVEEADAWGADLIILGSHGYGLWRRTLLGSVSNSVLHHAQCSVLVIRAKDA